MKFPSIVLKIFIKVFQGPRDMEMYSIHCACKAWGIGFPKGIQYVMIL